MGVLILAMTVAMTLGQDTAPPPSLETLRQELIRSESTNESIATLQRIAAFREDGAPTEAATKLLAAQLHDLIVPVRKEAARLLGKDQHATTASARLVEALDRMGEYFDALAEKQEDIRDRKLLIIAAGSSRSVKEKVKGFNELEEERRTIESKLDQEMEIGAILGRSLAGYPDPSTLRSLKSFYSAVETHCPRHLPVVADALLSFRAREGLARIVRSLGRYRAERGAFLKDETERASASRIDHLLKERLGVTPPTKEEKKFTPWGRELHERLEAFATKEKLPPVPRWDEEKFVEQTMQWFAECGQKLPSLSDRATPK